jgi:DNA-binding NarL/FixJ family response regulator
MTSRRTDGIERVYVRHEEALAFAAAAWPRRLPTTASLQPQRGRNQTRLPSESVRSCRCWCAGSPAQEIAAVLMVSLRTVEHHRANVIGSFCGCGDGSAGLV